MVMYHGVCICNSHKEDDMSCPVACAVRVPDASRWLAGCNPVAAGSRSRIRASTLTPMRHALAAVTWTAATGNSLGGRDRRRRRAGRLQADLRPHLAEG